LTEKVYNIIRFLIVMVLGLRLKRWLKIMMVLFFVLMLGMVIYSYYSITSDISIIEKTIRTLGQETINLLSFLKRISSTFLVETVWLIIFLVFIFIAINYLLNIYFLEKRHALVDELTEVYNRKAMNLWLHKEIERAKRFKHPLSIALMDLDKFKVYNDINGHLRGDWLLKTIARILKENARDIDFVGRYGGEEFIIIFPETGHNNALKACERVRKIIEEMKFEGEENLPTKKVTISIGLVTFCDKLDQGKMLKQADELLYEAKAKGRNVTVHRNVC